MNIDTLINLVVVVVGFLFVLIIWFSKSKTYTNEEWEAICKSDFEKYGPIPPDKE